MGRVVKVDYESKYLEIMCKDGIVDCEEHKIKTDIKDIKVND